LPHNNNFVGNYNPIFFTKFGKMVMIMFVKAVAFVAAIAPLEAFMPASTFNFEQVRLEDVNRTESFL
jgi:hypothetical protein